MRRAFPLKVPLRASAIWSALLPYMLLALAQIAVGAAAIFARYALAGAEPVAVAASRLAIAAAILLAANVVRRSRSAAVRLSARERSILAGSGVALAIHFATWIWSLQYTTIAISTLLVTSTPIWTATYDAVVNRKPLSRAALFAFVTGGVGLVAVVGFDRTPPPHPGHALAGALLALGGSVAIGAYFVLVRNVRERLDTQTIVTQTYSWAALALVLAAAALRQAPPSLASMPAWGGIVAMALISQLLGHTALNASLRWFSPSAIAFATLLEPVIAAALALLFFGEPVPALAVAGGAILLASIGVVLREERLPMTEPQL